MACASTIEEATRIAEQRWPGYDFRITGDEAHGACPICGLADKDGFIIYADGGTYCRPGQHSGWLDDDKADTLTAEEKRLRRIEAELARQRRKDAELERFKTAMERMHACRDHIAYHEQMTQRDLDYWSGEGIFPATVKKHKLGACDRCRTDKLHRPSYTIPVVNAKELCNILHRLRDFNGDPVQKDKYRPHLAGLGHTLFNADNVYLDVPTAMIVEGQKKSMVVNQYGHHSVGTMGSAGFQQSWTPRFERFGLVYVVYDPDAQEKAAEVTSWFNGRGRQVILPAKADDFFVLGGTPGDFETFLKLARKGTK